MDGSGYVDRASVGNGDRVGSFVLWSLLKDKGSVNPGQRVFRQQGGDFNSLLAECTLASTSLAFCDFDGQTVSSENFLAHSFIHIFIYSASAKHCDRTQKEHKP